MSIPPINFWIPDSIFMKLCMYIMAHEPISVAHFINPSHQSVRLYVLPPLIARKWLDKHIPAATIEAFLETSFSTRSVSYRRKISNWLFSERHVMYYPSTCLETLSKITKISVWIGSWLRIKPGSSRKWTRSASSVRLSFFGAFVILLMPWIIYVCTFPM
jgi:hypothetical protein